MSLRDRLTRLTGEAAGPSAAAQQDRISELRRKIDRVMNRRERSVVPGPPPTRRHVTPLEQVVAGGEARTPYGSFFLCDSTMGAREAHGSVRIGDVGCLNMKTTAFLAGLQVTGEMSLSGGLFLDTETTGLMGGTGTFPFLIGLGWFEAGGFVTRQLFARDFSEEAAMLRHVSELASERQFLVTFNGKAYDLNLLSARFILNRCRDTLTAMPHIDLLHPCRRIFAHRLENARLSTIEAQILGVRREGDVPGFEIPQRYFDWLRRRDGRLLGDVFTHNRLDIVSLAALLKHLSDLVEDSKETGHSHQSDLLKLAGLIQERGDAEKASRILETLTSSCHRDVAMGAQRTLSLICKRACRWDDAVRLWGQLLASDPHDVFAAEELAKFYEHHAGEPEKALQIVDSFLKEAAWLSDEERASLEHRLQRLVLRVSSRASR